LRRADLVKFANLTPEAAECEVALTRGEHIVRSTVARPPPPSVGSEPAPPAGDSGGRS
jgi:hypothetical protein